MEIDSCRFSAELWAVCTCPKNINEVLDAIFSPWSHMLNLDWLFIHMLPFSKVITIEGCYIRNSSLMVTDSCRVSVELWAVFSCLKVYQKFSLLSSLHGAF